MGLLFACCCFFWKGAFILNKIFNTSTLCCLRNFYRNWLMLGSKIKKLRNKNIQKEIHATWFMWKIPPNRRGNVFPYKCDCLNLDLDTNFQLQMSQKQTIFGPNWKFKVSYVNKYNTQTHMYINKNKYYYSFTVLLSIS